MKVLYVAYHFPPIGGAGVQRNGKFARYLPEFGWDPIVVTGPGPTTDRWTPEDETLLGDVAAGTEVRRVPGPEPSFGSGGWRGRAERWLGLPSPWRRWWMDGVLAAGRGAAGEVDVLLAATAPYETAEVVSRLARKLGKPWVADLQDPWAFDEMWAYPTLVHRLRDVARMRRVLGTADAVVMNTPESASLVRRRFPELADRLVVSIPNGFDTADFEGPAPARDDAKFRIVHTGYLHTAAGRAGRLRRRLGGGTAKVNILTRSHVYLLRAIDQLIAEDPSLADTIELHLAGVLSDVDREEGRHPVVRFRGYLPHPESVGLIRSADLLFLPMHDLPAGRRMSIVPGKTYEYLATGRPILAAVPDGDARELVERAGTGLACAPSDVDAMARILREELARFRADGHAAPLERSPVMLRYERRRLAGDLAAVFDQVAKPVAERQPALAAAS